MNKVFLLLLVAISLNACGAGMNSPRGVAAAFMENIAHGKIDQAKKLATESTGRLLDFGGNMPGMKIDPNFKFNFVKDSIVDNEAWVFFINTSGTEESLHLVKLDGKWKVHMDTRK